jgi:hypothetical protein
VVILCVQRRLPFAIAFLALLPLLLQTACTSVAIYGADVKERIYPGLVVLEITPKATEVVAVSTRGLGLTFGTKSITLGYLQEFSLFAQEDSSCRAIFLVEDIGESQALRLELDSQKFNTLCVPNSRKLRD